MLKCYGQHDALLHEVPWPQGAYPFLLRADPILEEIYIQGSKHEITKVSPL